MTAAPKRYVRIRKIAKCAQIRLFRAKKERSSMSRVQPIIAHTITNVISTPLVSIKAHFLDRRWTFQDILNVQSHELQRQWPFVLLNSGRDTGIVSSTSA